ncbi:hypothetical protein BZA05DRAFT_27510 [Tricharina praecox]|uniref:uncharacterized protein n=1 Tax=Tricharina praecox TaxID=43433 RepID=UPI0022200129|nr:uncharacterized protein BZA05DRAFT_27510 [Tricharina praecox]KAI5853387.1 hypothetical protein BZA05DRAFT_27510 [Tricharina praecox]
MTDVHAALKTLSPTEHSEFPSDPSSLNLHLATSLADAHILISSLPPPTIIPESVTLPEPSDPDIAALQKEWKPVKLSAKENPVGISVFKLSAKDGKGTWFARRSIHTDIPFRRFKAGLQQEFQQPPKEVVEEGVVQGPVRGIGKDLRIHHETCELGKVEIFQLSAQFPGPSAPRDFVEGCLSSSAHPEDISAAASERGRPPSSTDPGDQPESSAEDRPKQFTLISKPVLNHPQGDERSGYVRGTYESVEFIREIPSIQNALARSQSTSDVPSAEPTSPNRPRGKTVGMTPEEAAQARWNCAVDWIMITRSDPGGSVPKWMVERGTPGGIVKDADKFLKWCRQATFLDDIPEASLDSITKEMEHGEKLSKDEGVKTHTKRHLAERGAPAGAVLSSDHAQAEISPAPKQSERQNGSAAGSGGGGGLFAGALGTVAAGMSSLAQSAIYSSSSYNPTPPPTSPSDDNTPSSTVSRASSPNEELDDSASETASIKTFATADSSRPDVPELPSRPASVTSTMTAASATHDSQSPEERALAQFLKEKQKLDEKLKREDHRRSEREKKIAEKHMKSLEKQERKYRRALEKANEKRQKEEEKRKREAQKLLERDEKGRRREIEELRKVVEGLTRENLALRQRIEELEGTKTKEGVEVITAEKVEA